MDVGHLLPVQGNTIFTVKGGPWDKLELRFDLDHAPEVISLDGHRYEVQMRTFLECMGGDLDKCREYMNDPEEIFDTKYIHKGKRENQ